jgi:hypothetical protein
MTVGVQILDEDGTLLHEFPANLGKPLLYRLLTVAKFTGEDETEIILNGFVADFGKALAERASPRSTIDQGQVHNDLSRQAWTRLANVLRDNILLEGLDGLVGRRRKSTRSLATCCSHPIAPPTNSSPNSSKRPTGV